eukprot:4026244-Pleurochrysis_carterae.AAC.1
MAPQDFSLVSFGAICIKDRESVYNALKIIDKVRVVRLALTITRKAWPVDGARLDDEAGRHSRRAAFRSFRCSTPRLA